MRARELKLFLWRWSGLGYMESRPMRARELKLAKHEKHSYPSLSRPMRARELKPKPLSDAEYGKMSRPMRARELKRRL